MWAQIMTHRVFSRNASSARATPVKEMIASVRRKPYYPSFYGKNKRGMVATEEIPEASVANDIWSRAMESAIDSTFKLSELNLHKQFANRILSPFSYTTGIITATEWDNFFRLRLAHDAQPEIQKIAKELYGFYNESPVDEMEPGKWYAPFCPDYVADNWRLTVSAASCARVSVMSNVTKEEATLQENASLVDRLINEQHMSPFEHQAMCLAGKTKINNFTGWMQYRCLLDLYN